MATPLQFLKAVPIFKSLSQKDLAAVSSVAKQEEAPKGKLLFSQDARGDSLYVVVKGEIKIFARSATGKTKTFAFLQPKDFFGEMALFGAGVRSAAAQAMEDSTLLTLRRKEFEDFLVGRPQVCLAVMRALCDRLEKADREIASFSFNSVLGRTAQILLDLAERHGKKTPRGVWIDKILSHKDLADMAGTAREMVSRVLSRFVRAGCLIQEKDGFILTDLDKLRGWIY